MCAGSDESSDRFPVWNRPDSLDLNARFAICRFDSDHSLTGQEVVEKGADGSGAPSVEQFDVFDLLGTSGGAMTNEITD